MIDRFFTVCFIFFSVYTGLLALYYLLLAAFAFFESRRRQEQVDRENFEELSASYFALPVTLIVPAYNEETHITNTVLSLLNLDYPLYEVIIVNDQSSDRTLQVLSELLDLEADVHPYRDDLHSGKLLGLYRSRKHPKVRVLSKARGQKKAGALNAALNLARFKYICAIDSDTLLEPDALMKVMGQVASDAEHIYGIGSAFGLANGFKIRDGRVMEKRFINKPVVAYQNLEYIRSFIGNRVAWSRWNAMPIVAGGFQVWRRDVVQRAGGFNPKYSSEDLEFTFRIHDTMVKEGRAGSYRIVMLPFSVGWTVGPDDVRTLIKQRNRWHRVTLEAIGKYKHIFLNPRYRALGTLTMPYFILYEAWGPFFETASVLLTGLGFLRGYFPLSLFLSFLTLMVLTNILATLIPLFSYQFNQKIFRLREIAYLIMLSLVEMFWYRGVIVLARFQGTVDYLKGVRTMDRIHDA